MLKKLFTASFICLIANLGFAAPSQTPIQLVQQGLDELSQVFDTHSTTFNQDPKALYAALNASLEPLVNFRYISARVMGGRYYKAATPAQKRAFAEVFQTSLVETFGKGLMEFNYHNFEIKLEERPSRYAEQDNVSLEVVAKNGKRYPITFTLHLENEQWKIINLIVNGVNLGLTFNSQFDRAMRDNQRNFDVVIANWSPEKALEEVSQGEAKWTLT